MKLLVLLRAVTLCLDKQEKCEQLKENHKNHGNQDNQENHKSHTSLVRSRLALFPKHKWIFLNFLGFHLVQVTATVW